MTIAPQRSGRRCPTSCVSLKGGLGNQLFQLCAAIVASGRTGFPFLLDRLPLMLSRLPGRTTRSFALAELVGAHELSSCLVSVRNLAPLGRRRVLHEVDMVDDVLQRLSGRSRYLKGYFQRASIVEEASADLLNRITSSTILGPLFSVRPKRQIAVHVRCGDYLTASNQNFHGLTTSSYFENAIRHLTEITSIRELVVFSDEPLRARKLFENVDIGENQTVRFSTQAEPWSDIAELATSSAIVLTNSSFSWWGGYLATKLHNAVVAAPRPWYAEETGVEQILLHQKWHVLPRNIA